jgi:ABC-2 type transport system permease protein
MDLLLVSPVSLSEILNGKMLTAVIIVPMQAILWIALVSLNRIAVHNIGSILLLVSVTAIIIVLLGAIIAVKYRDRAISQYLYSLILIPLFLSVYLYANSPFNLVARLSADAAGTGELIFIGLYAALAFLLYTFAKKAIRSSK